MHRIKCIHYYNEPVLRFVHLACANSAFSLTFLAPFHLYVFIASLCFHRVLVKENVAFRLHNLLKEYKVFVHNLWKSACVRVECSIAEEYEDTLGWEANRSTGYCLPCLELLHPMTLNQALWKMNPSLVK